jgi:TolB-like protein/Tfp pilus assembly protein PilF
MFVPTTTTNAEVSLPNNFSSKIHRQKVLTSFLIIFLMAFAGFFTFKYFTTKSRIESIAVMPFVNESQNADIDYLSDGMTDTLINSLSQIPNLNVKARSSVFRYKGKEIDLKKIASELNVEAILTGRIVQNEEQIILNLELINAQTENVIWGKRYERKISELVALQSEVAHDVSINLESKLSGEDAAKVEKNYTANAEAYQLYLKGRFYWNKRNIKDFEKAIEYFNQAIEKDPNYAIAYSGLADTYALMPLYGNFRPNDYMPKAKQSALKALELDNDLAEAHASLGRILNSYDFDWEGAEREFKKEIELNPNYATVHQWYAEYLAFKEMPDEALNEISKALELDPFSVAINRTKGNILLFAKRYDEAIAQLKKTEELYPENALVKFNIGDVFAAKGMYSEAVDEYINALQLDGLESGKLQNLQTAFKNKGWQGFWQEYLEEKSEQRNALLKKDNTAYINNEQIAYVYAAVKDKNKALEYLNKAYEERDPDLITIKMSHVYDFLSDEPAFKDLIKNIGLPE